MGVGGLIGYIGIAALPNRCLVFNHHMFCSDHGDLEGHLYCGPRIHILQSPCQYTISKAAAMGRRTLHICGMRRYGIHNGQMHCLIGGVGKTNGIMQHIAHAYLLAIDAYIGVICQEYILFHHRFYGVVGNRIGCVGIHTVADHCSIRHHLIRTFHLDQEGNRNALSLFHIQDPADMGTHIASAMGCRIFHIGGIGGDGICNIHRYIFTGVVAISNRILQNITGRNILAVDLRFRITCQINLLLGNLPEGCIGKTSRNHQRRGCCRGCTCIQILHLHSQLAVAHICDLHTEAVHRAIVDHICLRIGRSIFHNRIEENTDLIKVDRFKCVAAADILCRIQQSSPAQIKAAIRMIQAEGELLVHKCSTGQRLDTVKGDGCGLGCIGIFKTDLRIFHICHGMQHTIGICDCNSDCNGMIGTGIDHTGDITCHFTNGIGVRTRFRIGQCAECKATICLIGHRLQQFLARIQLEAELTNRHCTTNQILCAGEGVGGCRCNIAIAESNHIGNRIFKIVFGFQTAAGAVIGNFHHQIKNGSIICHAI